MTYNVVMGTINPTHSLTHSLTHLCLCSVCVCSVDSYTREAGVRTLERRIGAVCRAVAVNVAEHMHKVDVSKPSTSRLAADTESSAKGRTKEPAASETVDITNVSSLTIPPKLPIVIDVSAVENILGVGTQHCLLLYYLFVFADSKCLIDLA